MFQPHTNMASLNISFSFNSALKASAPLFPEDSSHSSDNLVPEASTFTHTQLLYVCTDWPLALDTLAPPGVGVGVVLTRDLLPTPCSGMSGENPFHLASIKKTF